MVRHVRTIDQIKYCPLDQTHRHVYWAGRTLCRHSSLWSMSRYQSQRQLQWGGGGAGGGGGRRRRWKSAPGAWGLAGSSALLHILPTPMVNYTHTSKQIPRHSSNESLFSCWAFGFWRGRNPTAELQRERSQGFTSVTSHTPLSQKKKEKATNNVHQRQWISYKSNAAWISPQASVPKLFHEIALMYLWLQRFPTFSY